MTRKRHWSARGKVLAVLYVVEGRVTWGGSWQQVLQSPHVEENSFLERFMATGHGLFSEGPTKTTL
jgi:hypothetical protein